jgi:hypothetical protein
MVAYNGMVTVNARTGAIQHGQYLVRLSSVAPYTLLVPTRCQVEILSKDRCSITQVLLAAPQMALVTRLQPMIRPLQIIPTLPYVTRINLILRLRHLWKSSHSRPATRCPMPHLTPSLQFTTRHRLVDFPWDTARVRKFPSVQLPHSGTPEIRPSQ